MKKLRCKSCGSSSLKRFYKFYKCSYCSSIYPIETPKVFSLRKKTLLVISFMVVNILGLNYYFWIDHKEKKEPIYIVKKVKVEVKKDKVKYIKLDNKNIESIITTDLKLTRKITQMRYSSKSNYIYTIMEAGGFRIFEALEDNEILKRGKFAHKNAKAVSIYKLNKKEKLEYDFPTHFEISKDEKFAYVSDKHRGFYILDISDKKSIKLVSVVPNLKLKLFVLSKDERYIITYNKGNVLKIDISNPHNIDAPTIKYKEKKNYLYDIKLSHSKDILFIAKLSKIYIYSLKINQFIGEFRASTLVEKIVVSPDDKFLYLLKFYKGIDVVSIEDMENIKVVKNFNIKSGSKEFDFSEDFRYLYLATIKGIKVFDLKGYDNKSKLQAKYIYKSDLYNFANKFCIDKGRIFIGFSLFGALGVAQLKN